MPGFPRFLGVFGRDFVANLLQIIFIAMAYEKLILDKRRANKEGKYPVKIYIRHKGAILLSTSIYAPEENFKGGLLSKREPDYKPKNIMLANLLTTAMTEVALLDSSGRLRMMTDKQLKDHLTGILFGSKNCDKSKIIGVFNDFVASKINKKTQEIYISTRNRLRRYDEGCTFDAVDKRWLELFDKSMAEEGLKINARGVHMRNLRAVFNYAIDNDITNNYPFRRFRIKKEETMKRSLTVSQLRELMSMEVEDYQEQYRDLFLLVFYLIGINIGNLLTLKKTDIKNGRIDYYRNKTNKLISVKIQPEAAEIIERYAGSGDYLLNVMDRYSDYRNFVRRMNMVLGKIGICEIGKQGKKTIKPAFDGLTTYWARHTWATIAASLDIPKETIAHALSHSFNTVTDVYIKFDERKVDEANRRVIDYVLHNK